MAETSQTLFKKLPPISYETWRQQVEAELAGQPFDQTLVARTFDGLEIQPLYSPRDAPSPDSSGFPGSPPFVRGGRPLPERGWRITVEERLSDLEPGVLATAAKQGAEQLWLTVDEPETLTVDALTSRLDGVDLRQTAVIVDAGSQVLWAAAVLLAVAERRGIAPGELRGGVLGDPLAELAATGQLPGSVDDAYDHLSAWIAWPGEPARGLSRALISTSPYHETGGAGAVDELAFAMASAVELLRRGTSAGLDVGAVASKLVFAFSVGGDLFLEIAKLRAARWLWSKVATAAGATASGSTMHLHARASAATWTARGALNNLLRGTTESFAAIVAGVDSLAVLPYDAVQGQRRKSGRRLTINTQHVLAEEAHLARVVDPAGGSWYLETLTETLARKAWEHFRDIENRGGMAASLASGWVAEQLRDGREKRRQLLAQRRRVIVGVSDFVTLDEPAVPPTSAPRAQGAANDEAETGVDLTKLEQDDGTWNDERLAMLLELVASGAPFSEITSRLWREEEHARAEQLEPWRLAEPFEALLDASDRWLTEHGERPKASVLDLGPTAETRARVAFARGFLAVGGLAAELVEPADQDLDALVAEAVTSWKATGCELAVLCATDERYPELLPRLVPRLAEEGAHVVVAGRPGAQEAAWRAAGVDDFVFLGCDALATLGRWLSRLGILKSPEEAS